MGWFLALVLLHIGSTYALARLAKEIWGTHPIAAVALVIAAVGAVMAWMLFLEVRISRMVLIGWLGYLFNILIPAIVAMALNASFKFEDGVVPLLIALAVANLVVCFHLEILRD